MVEALRRPLPSQPCPYRAAGGLVLLVGASKLRSRRAGYKGQRRAAGAAPAVAMRARGGSAAAVEAEAPTVPVIVLSGFLGTGKTTLLKHWLENAESRIGVVVNDVAAINVDAKLVANQTKDIRSRVDTIQLENGCACCSLGDELLVTIYDLLHLKGEDDESFSHIVVEMSGVAEPKRVRDNFESTKKGGSPLTEGCELSKVVTVIDSSTFCTDYMEFSRIIDRPELLEGDSMDGANIKVVELLVEQVEAADVVILNKTDLAEGDNLEATRAVVKALNKDAQIVETSYGKVRLADVVSSLNKVIVTEEHEHEHGHGEHGHAEQAHSHGHASDSQEPERNAASHEHSHGHSHASDCQDVECNDASHDHSHGHSHASDCQDVECNDASHGNSHGHSHGHDSECGDPDCTDTSHGHTHSHSSAKTTTADERFGIRSFTYTARRPFDGEKLSLALQQWPVSRKDCLSDMLLDSAAGSSAAAAQNTQSPLTRVIRSKGFCWLDTYPSSRMYWSHAGKNMALEHEGVWWGAMTREQLQVMEQVAGDEYKRSQKEEFIKDYADRRQELVFIGLDMDEDGITKLMDSCLLDEEKMENYQVKQEEDKESLGKAWLNGFAPA